MLELHYKEMVDHASRDTLPCRRAQKGLSLALVKYEIGFAAL